MGRIPWYYMPISEQKSLGSLLHRMQNGLSLAIGPLGELNYEMATHVRPFHYMNHIKLSSNINIYIMNFIISDDEMYLSISNDFTSGLWINFNFTIRFFFSLDKLTVCKKYFNAVCNSFSITIHTFQMVTKKFTIPFNV